MSLVAAIQMCSSASVDENLAVASRLIQQAAKEGNAKLVVLPEMFAILGVDSTDKVRVKENFGSGKIQDFLANQAVKQGIYLVGGTIPLTTKNLNKVSAACLVYNPQGQVIARYNKMHLFDVVLSDTERYQESDTTEAGDEPVVVDTPPGKLGLTVCYDIRFPTLFNCLLNQGAEILTIPAAFTVKTGQAHWQLLARSRAVENSCYVIGACQGGTHKNGRQTYGHSLIVDPWGTVVQELSTEEQGVIYADIDLKKLYQIRTSIPIATHQRIFTALSSPNNNINPASTLT